MTQNEVLSYSGKYYDFDEDFVSDIDSAATRVNADTVVAGLSRVVTKGDLAVCLATAHSAVHGAGGCVI